LCRTRCESRGRGRLCPRALQATRVLTSMRARVATASTLEQSFASSLERCSAREIRRRRRRKALHDRLHSTSILDCATEGVRRCCNSPTWMCTAAVPTTTYRVDRSRASALHSWCASSSNALATECDESTSTLSADERGGAFSKPISGEIRASSPSLCESARDVCAAAPSRGSAAATATASRAPRAASSAGQGRPTHRGMKRSVGRPSVPAVSRPP
jgi:hypothetical protein